MDSMECKFIKEEKSYSVTEDTRVRSEVKVPEGMVVVSVTKLQALLKDSELAHKVRELVKESEGKVMVKDIVVQEIVVVSQVLVVGRVMILKRNQR